MKLPIWMSIPITPLLAALYPFVYFLAANLNQFREGEIWRTFFVLVGASILPTALLWLITRNWQKAALAVATLLLGFLTYGHWFQWIKNAIPTLARTFLWFPLAVLLIGALLWRILRSKRDLRQPASVSNLILMILILISLVPLVSYWMLMRKDPMVTPTIPSSKASMSVAPDLYLIILDEYTRSDVLRSEDQFDNSPFTSALQDLGFVIIPCSQSNYAHTNLSIYTMLNLEYPGNLPVEGDKHQIRLSYNEIAHSLRHSLLREIMLGQGYRTVAFDTGFPFSEFTDSDFYTKFDFDPGQVNHFETVYQNTTMILALRTIGVRLGWVSTSGFKYDPSEDIESLEESPEYNYAMKQFGLRELDKSTEITGPKFVFAHLLAPHRPIVMDRFGKYTGLQKMTPKTYTDQIRYVNQRVLASVTEILARSQVEPIIILLSDHGSRESMETIFTNFISVYAPQSVQDQLYDSITPVNVTRIVAGYLLNEDYPLLPDYSFLEDDQKRTSFSDIQKGCVR